MLFSQEDLPLLERLASFFVADLKFGNDLCAEALSEVDSYWGRATGNILAASRFSRVIVRHLVLPGHLMCCTKPALHWAAEHNLPVNVMFHYYPARSGIPALERQLDEGEINQVHEMINELGIELAHTGEGLSYHPLNSGLAPQLPTEIIVDRQGRIIIPDLPIELAPLARRLARGI